jgi:hypothetical protein
MGSPGHVARMGEERGENRVSVGRPEGMRPLGSWEDNIKSRFYSSGMGGCGLDSSGSG